MASEGNGPKKPRFDLRKALFILPNLFTLSSIFCGFYAIVISFAEPTREGFYNAAMLIVFAMLFDTLDGRVARLTKTQSAFGVQIDSLADVCSFGVAPAVLVYRWSLAPLGTAGMLVAFGFLACGAIRLARFNVLATAPTGAPKKPSKYIVGLPIPGAAGVLVSLVVANHAIAGRLPGPQSPLPVAIVVVVLSLFMVSTVPFRSFKDVRLNVRTVLLVAAALGSSAVIALRFHIAFSLVWLLACYVAIAVLEGVIRVGMRVTPAGRARLARERAEEQDTSDRR